MKPKDLIFWLSLLLAELTIMLLAKPLSRFLIPLSLLYISGWTFSWFAKDKEIIWIKPLLTIGILLVVAGIVYSIVNSFLLFQEIILIFTAAIVIIIALLSFNSYLNTSLNCIQILTFPLFIAFPVFTEYNHQKHLMIILLYILIWFVIMRLKFYLYLNQEKIKINYIASSLLISVIALSFIATIIIYSKVPPSKEKSSKFSLIERLDKETEDRYYAILNDILKQADGLDVKDTVNKAKTLFFLSSLLKEFPATQEVLKSTLGLVDHLNIKGPGIERGKIPEFLFTLKNFLKEKAHRGMIQNHENIKSTLSENNLSIKDKLSTLTGINKISRADEYSQIDKLHDKVKKTIGELPLDKRAGQELQRMSEEFKNWKLISLYTTNIMEVAKDTETAKMDKALKEQLNILFENIQSFPGRKQLEESNEILQKVEKHKDAQEKNEKEMIETYKNILGAYSSLAKDMNLSEYSKDSPVKTTAILESIEIPSEPIKLAPGEKKQLRIIAKYADGSKEEIAQQGKWKIADKNIASIEGGTATGLAVGETKTTIEYLYKTSEPLTIIVEEPAIKTIVLFPSGNKVQMGKSIKIEARAYYSDFIYKDITSLAKWNLSRPKSIKITGNDFSALSWGKVVISAEYQGIKSQEIQIVITSSVFYILKIIGLLLLLLLAIVLFLSYILQKIREKRIKELLKNNPRHFIIALFNNIRLILNFFKIPYNNTALLQYAKTVAANIPYKDDIFLDLTYAYAKANYSSNKLTLDEGINVLDNYNKFLKMLAKKEGAFSLLIKHLLILLKGIPFLIKISK